MEELNFNIILLVIENDTNNTVKDLLLSSSISVTEARGKTDKNKPASDMKNCKTAIFGSEQIYVKTFR